MTSSFKTTTLIAAIGMMVYTIYVITRYVIHQLSVVRYNFDLWEDICAKLHGAYSDQKAQILDEYVFNKLLVKIK